MINLQSPAAVPCRFFLLYNWLKKPVQKKATITVKFVINKRGDQHESSMNKSINSNLMVLWKSKHSY